MYPPPAVTGEGRSRGSTPLGLSSLTCSFFFIPTLATAKFRVEFRNELFRHFQFFNRKFCFAEALLPITYGLRSLASIDWLPFHEIFMGMVEENDYENFHHPQPFLLLRN